MSKGVGNNWVDGQFGSSTAQCILERAWLRLAAAWSRLAFFFRDNSPKPGLPFLTFRRKGAEEVAGYEYI